MLARKPKSVNILMILIVIVRRNWNLLEKTKRYENVTAAVTRSVWMKICCLGKSLMFYRLMLSLVNVNSRLI